VTLVELIVVLACFGVLVPLIAASGSAMTRPNRERMCAFRLGRLGTAMLQYTIENDGYLPGSPGTSGAQVIYDYLPPPSAPPVIFPSTQTWDWAAPLAPYLNVALDPSRAKRVEQFREGHFWCPSNDYQSEPYNQGTIGPTGDWQLIRMLSFLTTRNFLLYGSSAPIAPELESRARWSAVMPSGVSFPSAYSPRLDQLGSTSQKVFLSDGSRFLTPAGTLDHDIDPRSSTGGMFSDGGPTQKELFLRSYLLNSPLKEYAYRHAHGDTLGLNLAFHDGHVSWMSEPLSRHPRWWWPPGTALPASELNQASLLLVFEEMLNDPEFKYRVP
jgi:prepilin-type processing-associated H-X9-DG protein